MTPREHQQEFYETLARAISQWQHVEGALFEVFSALTLISDRNVASAVFFSPLNFNIKLKMVDSAAQFALMDSPLLEEWNKLHNKASKRADKRNELVHFMVIGGSGKPGETGYHLRPNIFDAKSALHYQAKGGIPEYTTKQLVEKAASFGRLAMKIDAFAHLLRGEKALWHDKFFPPEVHPREKGT